MSALCVSQDPYRISQHWEQMQQSFILSTNPTQKRDNRKLTTNSADKESLLLNSGIVYSKRENSSSPRPQQINTEVREHSVTRVHVCAKGELRAPPCVHRIHKHKLKIQMKSTGVRVFQQQWKSAKPSHHLEQSIICLHFQPLPPDLLLQPSDQGECGLRELLYLQTPGLFGEQQLGFICTRGCRLTLRNTFHVLLHM